MAFNRAVEFIWENARLLDRAIFEYHFAGGPASRVIDILRTYQNPDGGFGHALEPDLRAPDSQPLFVEFALRTLYENGLRDRGIAMAACDFLARHASLEAGIAPLFPSSQNFPRAAHWHHLHNLEPSFDRLIGVVGLARWQDIRHPWLDRAVEACLEKIAATSFTDAHTINTSFTLLESVCAERDVEPLFQKLASELVKADWYVPDAPVTVYGVTPLEFAPAPDSYCRRLFTSPQIDGHLADLESKQEPDGGWSILWVPPDGAARSEWRASKTVVALSTLKAYERLS